MLGVVPTSKALEAAREAGMDLVEVAPNERPPVCKVIDYGKFKYTQKKKHPRPNDVGGRPRFPGAERG